MRIAVAVAVACALGACDGDTLRIAFQISPGPVQACPSAAAPEAPACGDVPLACEAVLNIRVVRPSSPQETYVPLCAAIPRERGRDLCSIEQISLPSRALPKETLEVQVMIWPRDAVKEDPDTGELDCREIYGQPVSIGFGVDGFPEEIVPSPALGGRAYYRPGDDLTVVTLGCSDLAAVNRPSCSGGFELRADVREFDTWAVPPPSLLVSVGEPRYVPTRDAHEWAPIESLELQDQTWLAAVDALPVVDSVCVEVIGNTGPNTAAVHCERLADPTDRTLELTGYRLPTDRLDDILAGLGLPEVPPQGLTIGAVLDDQGQPAAGYEIRTSPATAVQYLSATGQVVPGAVTTTSGLFVSRDAPYGAGFGAYQGSMERATGIGGRVSGKVTIVVLRAASG